MQLVVVPCPLSSLLVCQSTSAHEGLLGLGLSLLATGVGWGFALEECLVRFTHLFTQVFSGTRGCSAGLQLRVWRAAGAVTADPTSRQVGVDSDRDLSGGFAGIGVAKEMHALTPPDPVRCERL